MGRRLFRPQSEFFYRNKGGKARAITRCLTVRALYESSSLVRATWLCHSYVVREDSMSIRVAKLEKLHKGTIYRELDPVTEELVGETRFGLTDEGLLRQYEFCFDKGCWVPCELPDDFRIPPYVGEAGFLDLQEAAHA